MPADPYALRREAERLVGEDRLPTEELERLCGEYGGSGPSRSRVDVPAAQRSAKEGRNPVDAFRMRAFALFPDGKCGDAFAEVAAPSLVACFAQMSGEVADWLPVALAHAKGEPPLAIELTLEWSGAPAAEPAPGRPAVPSDPARRRPSAPRRALRCADRRRLGCAGVGFTVGAELSGAGV